MTLTQNETPPILEMTQGNQKEKKETCTHWYICVMLGNDDSMLCQNVLIVTIVSQSKLSLAALTLRQARQRIEAQAVRVGPLNLKETWGEPARPKSYSVSRGFRP